MKERFVPVALLVAVGIMIPLTHDALRSAAAVTFLALVIPAWRVELAAWFTYSCIVLAFLLGAIWYLGDFEVQAWAFAGWAALISAPLMAESLTDEVEEHDMPRTSSAGLSAHWPSLSLSRGCWR